MIDDWSFRGSAGAQSLVSTSGSEEGVSNLENRAIENVLQGGNLEGMCKFVLQIENSGIYRQP